MAFSTLSLHNLEEISRIKTCCSSELLGGGDHLPSHPLVPVTDFCILFCILNINLLLCALKSIFISINHVGGGGVQFFKIIGEQ